MSRDPAGPIAPADFARAFAAHLDRAAPLLLAVSGGPDSMALLGAAADWAREEGPAIRVATVDHGLRHEAAQEADSVAALAASLGLPHETLVWRPEGRPVSQARARAARWSLLATCAERAGIGTVLTAHHRDDQAETLLIRMAAGSGPGGLAGMRPASRRGTLRIVRPLLAFPKTRLVATCVARGWPYAVDPGNADRRYARARWRALAGCLAEEGLDAARLARLAERIGRMDDALAAYAEGAFRDLARPHADGGLRLPEAVLSALPGEISLRVLGLAVRAAAGAEAPLSLHRLEACHDALAAARTAGQPCRRTLGGCTLDLSPAGLLTLRREPERRRGRGAR